MSGTHIFELAFLFWLGGEKFDGKRWLSCR
jgi:hypothetical protein